MHPRTKILGTRETPEVYAAVQAAARAAGISTSEWISRRLRNNLRRTGRLGTEQPQPAEASQ